MPYKDIERKKEWERLHRPERLARRRELRRINAAQEEAQPERIGNGRNEYELKGRAHTPSHARFSSTSTYGLTLFEGTGFAPTPWVKGVDPVTFIRLFR